MESMATISAPTRSAIASASDVLPEAVGPVRMSADSNAMQTGYRATLARDLGTGYSADCFSGASDELRAREIVSLPGLQVAGATGAARCGRCGPLPAVRRLSLPLAVVSDVGARTAHDRVQRRTRCVRHDLPADELTDHRCGNM